MKEFMRDFFNGLGELLLIIIVALFKFLLFAVPAFVGVTFIVGSIIAEVSYPAGLFITGLMLAFSSVPGCWSFIKYLTDIGEDLD